MKPLGVLGVAAGAVLVARKVAAATVTVPFRDIFERMAAKYGTPMRLMVAIVSHESGFDPRAVNRELAADASKGRDVDSLGLGQILWPDTARDYGVTSRESLFDPATNLDVVARVLRDKLRRYPAAPGLFPADAVSAYNGGHSLRREGGAFANQDYVDRVRERWEAYADV